MIEKDGIYKRELIEKDGIYQRELMEKDGIYQRELIEKDGIIGDLKSELRELKVRFERCSEKTGEQEKLKTIFDKTKK